MPDLQALLYQALASPIGIIICVKDFNAVQTALYDLRRTLNDPALACLSFRHAPSNPNTQLWIVRNAA